MMEGEVKSRLASFAFGTRLTLIVIQFLSNVIIPDHDAGVFSPPIERRNFSALDQIVELGFGGFQRWDAVYFIHIAEHGYTYENCAAFFPLYPIIITFCGRCLSFLTFGFLHLHTSLLVSSVIVNLFLFVLTTKNFYSLSQRMGFSQEICFVSSFLLCINPSSIFMSAPYSETLYMFLLVFSLDFLQKRQYFMASVCVGLSILTRSNGLVGIGFIVHSLLFSFTSFLFSQLEKSKYPPMLIIKSFLAIIFRGFISVLLCAIPFFLYQIYIYLKFCKPELDKISLTESLVSYGRSQNYKLVGDSPSSWCMKTFPFSYSYIQSHYWGVGFLKYYQFKQIPNFILAAPVIYLSLKACIYFFNLNPKLFYGLGLINFLMQRKKDEQATIQEAPSTSGERLASMTAVFVFHLAFLLLFGCVFVHIQVLTRMLFSSSPLLYWYCAIILMEDKIFCHLVEKQLGVCEQAAKLNETETDKTSHSLEETQQQHTHEGTMIIHGRRSLRVQEGRGFQSQDYEYHCWKSPEVNILIHVYLNWSSLSGTSKFIILYFGSYFIVGTILFSNFLPWT